MGLSILGGKKRCFGVLQEKSPKNRITPITPFLAPKNRKSHVKKKFL